jgi:hypothetical protein
VNHGIENEQYFQGCGVSFTEFEDVATGIGNNYHAALDDALDSLAQGAWDVESNQDMLMELSELEERHGNESLSEHISEDCYYYASIRVR